MSNKDTIFALSTPSGKSAIAIVRISGKGAHKIIKKIISKTLKKPNRPTLCHLQNLEKKIIDKSVVTLIKEPKSYTGENMVEISLHGGPAIIKKTLETLSGIKNCRPADPGEFTKRAFLNNKLDLIQAEAIEDVINADTEEQRKMALNQLEGAFSKKIYKWSILLKDVLAKIEASIDFADEDLPENLIKECKEQIKNIEEEIKEELSKEVGEKIRDGFLIAVVGKTNTGKSTFINNIANREVSIVTKIPGTTRDIIEVFVDFNGFAIKFYDTAGLRKSKNIVEKKGIKKTHDIIQKSDINLVFISRKSDVLKFYEIPNKIYVQSKIDIVKKIKLAKKQKIMHISSKKGYGIKHLFAEISKKLIKKNNKNGLISRERHRNALVLVCENLKKSRRNKNIDMVAEDIRVSVKEMSKITGKTDFEDILDIIFSSFCIGK